MEAAISAIAAETFSRMVSFLIMKYKGKTTIEEKLERLQQLLLRIHAVVEEADIRYITNRSMLMQLKVIVESMYHGYHILDIFRHKPVLERISHEEVRSSGAQLTSSSSQVPFKRSRTISGATRGFPESNNDLQRVLENLEAMIDNMKEFVLLLGGCDRCRRPYDTYLYTDNFIFGRHVEKQHIINILLQDPGKRGTPLVLPIIGGCRVGKKTLVFHVCQSDRIKSHFSSIMFINGDNIRSMDRVKFPSRRMLVVIEFLTDVNDNDWENFYSTVKQAAVFGSKVIIISRIQSIVRFGTVKAMFLKSLSHEEFKYLFKILAFGSMDEKDYPQLAAVASEIAPVLGGSLITANVIADLLRSNHDFHFWLGILKWFKGMVDKNLSAYGEHPKEMLENERSIDISMLFNSPCFSTRRLMPPRVERGDSPKQKLDNISLGDVIKGSISIPNYEFVLVGWESRLPPYTKFVHEVSCSEEKQGCLISPRKRRSVI